MYIHTFSCIELLVCGRQLLGALGQLFQEGLVLPLLCVCVFLVFFCTYLYVDLVPCLYTHILYIHTTINTHTHLSNRPLQRVGLAPARPRQLLVGGVQANGRRGRGRRCRCPSSCGLAAADASAGAEAEAGGGVRGGGRPPEGEFGVGCEDPVFWGVFVVFWGRK
jgi:hypothetical protein